MDYTLSEVLAAYDANKGERSKHQKPKGDLHIFLKIGGKGKGQETIDVEVEHIFADPDTAEQVVAKRLAKKRKLKTSKTGEAYESCFLLLGLLN